MNLPKIALWTLLTAVSCQAGVVADWNGAVLAAIRPQTPAPLLLVRNLSIVHRAAFDAANWCTPESGFTSFTPPVMNQPEGVSPDLAAAFAAHFAAVALIPSARPMFDTLLEDQLAGANGEALEKARVIGEAAAELQLNQRREDRLSATVTYVPRPQPGEWRRTPPKFRPPELPQGRYVRPYVLQNIDAYLPPGPPSLDSPAWAEGLELIRDIGALNSTTRTAEQSMIARFWSDFSYTITPPGHWNQIAVAIAAERQFSLLQEAHLLAWLNTNLLDAGIVCWEAKYRYNFWRPITAIHEADRDGLASTLPDVSWRSFLESPPHPEYPSGHSSFSGAAARFLQQYFGTDTIRFSATSDSVPGQVFEYDSLWACAEQISMSRIYGGIHYLFSGNDGLQSGRKVAEAVFTASQKAMSAEASGR